MQLWTEIRRRVLAEGHKLLNHIIPAAHSAGTVNGDAIDTNRFDEASYTLATGVIDAGITGVDLKVQESADGSTGWADIRGAAIASLDGDDDGVRGYPYRQNWDGSCNAPVLPVRAWRPRELPWT